MSDTPISDFIQRSSCFHVHDLAVLIFLVGVQERGWPISPIARYGKFCYLSGLTEEEYQAAFQRLLENGEIVKVETEKWRGYEVARMENLEEGMMDFGKRMYFRRAAKRSRERVTTSKRSALVAPGDE